MGSESCSVGRNIGKIMEIGRDMGDNFILGKDNKEIDFYRFSNWVLYILLLGVFFLCKYVLYWKKYRKLLKYVKDYL